MRFLSRNALVLEQLFAPIEAALGRLIAALSLCQFWSVSFLDRASIMYRGVSMSCRSIEGLESEDVVGMALFRPAPPQPGKFSPVLFPCLLGLY